MWRLPVRFFYQLVIFGLLLERTAHCLWFKVLCSSVISIHAPYWRTLHRPKIWDFVRYKCMNLLCKWLYYLKWWKFPLLQNSCYYSFLYTQHLYFYHCLCLLNALGMLTFIVPAGLMVIIKYAFQWWGQSFFIFFAQ